MEISADVSYLRKRSGQTNSRRCYTGTPKELREIARTSFFLRTPENTASKSLTIQIQSRFFLIICNYGIGKNSVNDLQSLLRLNNR